MDEEKWNLESFPTSESALRMLSYVSQGFYDTSYVGKWLYQVMGLAYDEARRLVEELPYQMFPETATWGLRYHEIKWQLPVREGLSYKERRKLIYQKRDTRAPMTPYAMERYLSNITDFEVHISDIHDRGTYGFVPIHPNLFQVTFVGEGTLEADRIFGALRKIKQSHTDFIAKEWICMLLKLIVFYKVKLYFLSACYPRYNIPYLKYDGTAQYNGKYRYNKYKTGEVIDLYPMALTIHACYRVAIRDNSQLDIKGIMGKWSVAGKVTKLFYQLETIGSTMRQSWLVLHTAVTKWHQYLLQIRMKQAGKWLIGKQVTRLLYRTEGKAEKKGNSLLKIMTKTRESVCRYQVYLTIGYHLTRYDGSYRYDGTRKYDSAIIETEL